MPILMPLSLVHLAVLVGLSWATARRLFHDRFAALFAAGTLVWANLAVTALLASPFRWLGNVPAYLSISLLLQALAAFLIDRSGPRVALVPELRPTRVPYSGVEKALAAAVAAAVAGVVVIAFAALPNNWDTLAYRFPRPFFYLSSGALVHAGEGVDYRLLYYPYNGSLLYLFLAQYQWPPIAWNFVGVLGWLATGGASALLARVAGGTRKSAWLALFLVTTAPTVLRCASSGMDELLAAAPMTTAIAFLIVWYRRESAAALGIGLLAAGLAVGTKLHWVALAPALGVGLACLLLRDRRRLFESSRSALRPPLVTAALISVALASGFLVTNRISAGRFFEEHVSGTILNRPFHLGAAIQTTGLYTAQMLLTPLVDLWAALPGQNDAYERANAWGARSLVPHVRQGIPYTTPFYHFEKLVPGGDEGYVQGPQWLGLLPHAGLVVLGWLLWRRPAGFALPAFLLGVLPLWHVSYSALYRYMDGIQVYYAYPAPIWVAGLAWSLGRGASGDSLPRRLAGVTTGLLAVSATFLACVLLWSGERRNLPMAWRATSPETNEIRTSPELRAALSEARRVHIPYTHWELTYWQFMRLNPAARYFSGTGWHREDVDLTLLSLSQSLSDARYLPARAGSAGGLRRIPMRTGSDWVFCTGPACESSCGRCDRYLLLPLRYERTTSGSTLSIGGEPAAFASGNGLSVRLSLADDAGQPSWQTDWLPLRRLQRSVTSVSSPRKARLVIEVRRRGDETSGDRITEYPLR
jgi:hypothetical protein